MRNLKINLVLARFLKDFFMGNPAGISKKYRKGYPYEELLLKVMQKSLEESMENFPEDIFRKFSMKSLEKVLLKQILDEFVEKVFC